MKPVMRLEKLLTDDLGSQRAAPLVPPKREIDETERNHAWIGSACQDCDGRWRLLRQAAAMLFFSSPFSHFAVRPSGR
jgi:hypothetical protein